MAVNAIPDGYHTMTAYLYFKSCAEALPFYSRVFGAVEIMRMGMPGGRISHAEMMIGNSRVMMADESQECGNLGPISRGGNCCGFALYVEDCDTIFDRAVASGCTVVRPMEDQFYGDRSGTVTDPFGYQWTIATHKEDVSLEEVQARLAKMVG